MFFDDYPYFLKTSDVFADQARLNLRYEAIFRANRDILEGARVLDLASHDGRWSFAALQTGAAHVVGVEARSEAVDNARAAFAHYAVDPDSYEFVCGDIFDVLARKDLDVDVVLCLGYVYHTYRHTELFYRIRNVDPSYLIVDTTIVPRETEPVVKLLVDRTDKPGEAALDAFSQDDKTLVGRPSFAGLQAMLSAYTFGIERTYDWEALLAEHPDVKLGDYTNGSRVTVRCRTGAATLPPGKTPPAVVPPVGAATKAKEPEPSRRGWRGAINRGLAKATGYEVKRVR